MRVADGGEVPPTGTVADFGYGVLLGQSPQTDADGAGDGVTITKNSSWWTHRRCRRCGHTFRRGDLVLADGRQQTVVHLVPGLGCAGEDGADGAAQDVAALQAGLLSAWPPRLGVPVHRLEPGDWRLPTGPRDLREGNVCLYCGHTFRAGEYVIICPCRSAPSPENGGRREPACGRAVHRDPAAGLRCWESWRPDGTVPICPVTQVKISGG